MYRLLAVILAALLLSSAVAHHCILKNVECIAPASPGGGWDFTCRVPAAQVMSDVGAVEGNIKVTNMSGGGGGVAFSHVVTQRGDDENLIIAASVATATRLAQDVFAGFTADDVRWLGALGADFGVIAVPTDSLYESLDDLVNAMKHAPNQLTFVGGSAAGGFDHIKVLLVAQAAGISNEDLPNLSYVSFDGGGPALLEIKSGRADVFTGDTSEVLGDLDAGEVKVLAVFSPEPVERLGDAPTATEQGYDVVAGNWRGFYAPKNISDETYECWVEAVEAAATSETWAELRAENGLAPFESYGDDFTMFVGEQINLMQDISRTLGIIE